MLLCGMYLPETVTDGVALGAYLKESRSVCLRVQEVGEHTTFTLDYHRG